MPPHARSWNEGCEEEETAEDPPRLHEVGQLHTHIRMVQLDGEEEEEEELERVPARGSRDPQPLQGPDGGPVLERSRKSRERCIIPWTTKVESKERSMRHEKPRRTMDYGYGSLEGS